MENFKRGDIVWARVLFPQKWWPGVVLRIDILGVLVSFFGLQSYRYFLESEIVPFEPNFKSYCKNCNCSTSTALLDHALNLFGQRNLFDLLNRRRKASNLFNPQVALSFVRNVAVSPWIEEDDFLSAVRALAQVMAFRYYSFTASVHVDEDPPDGEVQSECTRQALREIPVKLQCHTDNHSEKEFFGFQTEDKLVISLANQTFQWTTQALRELPVNLQSPACNPFYLDGECLDNLKWSFLSFRNFSCKNTASTFSKECSPIESAEVRSSNSEYIKERGKGETVLPLIPYTESPFHGVGLKRKLEQFTLSNECFPLESAKAQYSNPEYVKERGNGETVLPLVPYMESPFYGVGLKRKLEQVAVSGPPPKLHKTYCLSVTGSDAHLWRREKKTNADPRPPFELWNLSPFPTAEDHAHPHRSIIGHEAGFFDSFFRSCLKINFQTLSSSKAVQSLKYISTSDLMGLVQKMLRFSHGKQKTSSSNIVKIGKVQKRKEYACKPVSSITQISHGKRKSSRNNMVKISKVQKEKEYACRPEGSITQISDACIQPMEESESFMKDDDTCIYYPHAVTEKILQPVQALLNSATGTQTFHDKTGDVMIGIREKLSSSHVTADQLKILPSNGANSISDKIGKEKLVTLEDTDPSLPTIKSQVGSEVETNSSHSLFMKFPKDYKLPPKEELVKKFSRFGRVDSFRTEVYFYTGSACVAFLDPHDAVTAFEYVKRKKILFDRVDVRFWLDPFEHNRVAKDLVTYPSMGKWAGSNLKSSLKKSKPPPNGEGGSRRKVRFLMVT